MSEGRKRGRPRKDCGQDNDGYINTTQQRILPASSRFMSADQIVAELGCSRSLAYREIHKINEELARKGFMTFAGRVLKSEWIRRTGGN